MTSSLYSNFGPRPIPARIGTRRHHILVRSLYGRTTKLSFSCSRDCPAKNSRSNASNGFKALNFLINLRGVLGFHDREPINEGTHDHGKVVRKHGKP